MKRRFLLLPLAILAVITGSLPAQAAPAIRFPSTSQSQSTAASSQAPIGELPERRTQASKTERTAPGKYRTTVFNAPVNYRDAQGKWQLIDSTLVGTTQGGYAWRNSANSFGVFFKKSLDPNYLRLDVGGKSFMQSLAGATCWQGCKRAGLIPRRLPGG